MRWRGWATSGKANILRRNVDYATDRTGDRRARAAGHLLRRLYAHRALLPTDRSRCPAIETPFSSKLLGTAKAQRQEELLSSVLNSAAVPQCGTNALEKSIDERRCTRGCQNGQDADQPQGQDDRDQPPLLVFNDKLNDFAQKRWFLFLIERFKIVVGGFGVRHG